MLNSRIADMISSLLLGALLAAAPAGATTGVIEALKGKVTVAAKGGKPAAVKAGASVPAGAQIETGKDAYALVALDDGSRIKLRDKSSVTLAAAKEGVTEVFLKLGSIFAKVKKKMKGEFHVRTPTALAAVRGTEFFTAYGRKKRKGHDLWLCVNEGAVEVAAGGDSVLVKQGKGIVIANGTKLTPPESFDWTMNLNWNMDPSKPLEDKTDLEGAYSDLLDQDYK